MGGEPGSPSPGGLRGLVGWGGPRCRRGSVSPACPCGGASRSSFCFTFYVFGMGELLLGLMFLFGAFTRYASAVAAAEMVLTVGLFGVPSLLTPRPNIGILKDVTTLGAALCLGLQGSYVLSVDARLRKKNPRWMV